MGFCGRIASAGTFFLLFFGVVAGQAQERQKKRVPQPMRAGDASATEAELARLRADVVESIKASRERLDRLLAIYEKNTQTLGEELEKRRALYDKGYIARAELEETERALAVMMTNAEEVRRWIMEDEMAMTEAVSRDELVRLPELSRGEYSETILLIRYNGAAAWSLGDAPKIEQFFSEMFGRALPVSALGQTPVHDRMRFDHRDAMDVAVHPDTAEGRALMAYLRQAGISFVAFRGKVPGSATGSHIHIGKPSIRTKSQ